MLGRLTAPTVDDRVRAVRDDASVVVAQLEALPIEYRQQLAGDEEFGKGGATDAVERARTQLEGAIGDAPWLTPTQIDAARGALDDVRTAAEDEVDANDFEAAVDAAVATLDDVFDTN